MVGGDPARGNRCRIGPTGLAARSALSSVPRACKRAVSRETWVRNQRSPIPAFHHPPIPLLTDPACGIPPPNDQHHLGPLHNLGQGRLHPHPVIAVRPHAWNGSSIFTRLNAGRFQRQVPWCIGTIPLL